MTMSSLVESVAESRSTGSDEQSAGSAGDVAHTAGYAGVTCRVTIRLHSEVTSIVSVFYDR